MFQRLTSLFFSDSNTPEGLEEPKPFVEEEEEEDGWLIIDLAGEESSRTGLPEPLLHLVSPELGKPLSWFVTPPPCFTAEEPGPDGVGSSPMEDLLIEHPSMSVYVTSTLEWGTSVSPHPSWGTPCTSGRDEPEPRPERPVAHHGRALAVKAAALDKAGQTQRAQRAKQLAERHRLGQRRCSGRPGPAAARPAAQQLPGAFVHQPCQRHCTTDLAARPGRSAAPTDTGDAAAAALHTPRPHFWPALLIFLLPPSPRPSPPTLDAVWAQPLEPPVWRAVPSLPDNLAGIPGEITCSRNPPVPGEACLS
uniref:Tumor protein p53 inducible nuclear protein 2 n=1 Tax=Malurus cyaneus samueli TaxID=2593467 RepID=A0A8C5U5K2_9PASS